jgi:hypothetical protein
MQAGEQEMEVAIQSGVVERESNVRLVSSKRNYTSSQLSLEAD